MSTAAPTWMSGWFSGYAETAVESTPVIQEVTDEEQEWYDLPREQEATALQRRERTPRRNHTTDEFHTPEPAEEPPSRFGSSGSSQPLALIPVTPQFPDVRSNTQRAASGMTMTRPLAMTSQPSTSSSSSSRWFAGTVGFRTGGGDEQALAYHERTRLGPCREGLLIDPGAYDNLVGERWVERQGALAQQRGRGNVTRRRMERELGVEGVGKEAQTASEQAVIPGVIRDITGHSQEATYTAPVLPDSEVPALLGLRSLQARRAILDMINGRLYLCGPGRLQLTPPPGTIVLPLESSRSGHLLLPFSDFDHHDQQQQNNNNNTREVQSSRLAFPSSLN